jgi:hypothetical protein
LLFLGNQFPEQLVLKMSAVGTDRQFAAPRQFLSASEGAADIFGGSRPTFLRNRSHKMLGGLVATLSGLRHKLVA